MKKNLLLALGCATTLSAAAQSNFTPTLLPEFYSMAISADGKVIVSQTEQIVIYNVDTKKSEVCTGWSLGNGNSLTVDGKIIVGSTEDDCPVIWKDGRELDLDDLIDKYWFCDLHAITADGKRVCGLIANPNGNDDLDAGMMYLPMYADLNDNNTITDVTILPSPTKDFFGQTPQYSSAVWISNDGKTILGQMVDNSGMCISPIIYKQAADGEWSYELPSESLFNPNKLPIPEYPGEFNLTPPEYTDFMSEEQKKLYNEAYQEYVESGYNYELYPEPSAFMSEEEINAYNTASDAYNEKAMEYNDKLMEYQEARYAIVDQSVFFGQNEICMNALGTMAAMGANREVAGEPTEWGFPSVEILYSMYLLDIEKGEFSKIDTNTTQYLPNQILSDGTLVSSLPMPGPNSTHVAPLSFVLKPGATEFLPLEKYLEEINPDAAKWLTDNMTKNVLTGYDYDEDYNATPIYTDMVMSGHVCFSDDKDVITGGVLAYTYSEEYTYESYLFTGTTTGVANVAMGSDANVEVLANGALKVTGVANSLTLCNIAGVNMYSATAVSGVVETGLAPGIYVLRYTTADGNVHSMKVKL